MGSLKLTFPEYLNRAFAFHAEEWYKALPRYAHSASENSNSDGDIVSWILLPDENTVRKNPLLRNVKLIIWND